MSFIIFSQCWLTKDVFAKSKDINNPLLSFNSSALILHLQHLIEALGRNLYWRWPHAKKYHDITMLNRLYNALKFSRKIQLCGPPPVRTSLFIEIFVFRYISKGDYNLIFELVIWTLRVGNIWLEPFKILLFTFSYKRLTSYVRKYW